MLTGSNNQLTVDTVEYDVANIEMVCNITSNGNSFVFSLSGINVIFLYGAVSNPQDCSNRYYTLLPGRHVLSNIGLYTPQFIVKYSFISLVNCSNVSRKSCPMFDTVAQDSNPCSLSCRLLTVISPY